MPTTTYRPVEGSRAPRLNVAAVTIPHAEGMSLDRLLALLEGIWDRRVGLIVAPPGAGKTTLLATFLSGADYPVAWYRADRWDDRQEALAARLAAAFDTAMSGRSRQWTTISDVASGLQAWDPTRALFAIDDLHAISGSPAEAAIEWLVDRLPEGLRVLIASRAQPGLQHLANARLGRPPRGDRR